MMPYRQAQITARCVAFREQIIELTALGMNPKEIAFELKRSPKTVEYHISQIKHQLGLNNSNPALLTHYAISKGLVPLLSFDEEAQEAPVAGSNPTHCP